MSLDQEELLLKAQESINAAKLLLEGGFAGFAVSRAYYAMFYVAQALLEGEGLAFSKHSAVIAALGRYFIKTGRIPEEYHRYLLDAFEARHEGDYAPVSSFTPETSRMHVDRAEKFLVFTATLLAKNS